MVKSPKLNLGSKEKKKRSERANLLTRSEVYKELVRISDISDIGMAYINKQGLIVEINKKVTDIYGKPKKELIGKSLDRIGIHSMGDIRKLLGNFEDALSEKERPALLKVKDVKGQNLFLECWAIPIKLVGKSEGAIVIIRDFTGYKKMEKKLKENEKKYERVFATAQEGILILDFHTGKIENFNPYLQKLLGYPPKELIGKEVWHIIPFKNIVSNKTQFAELIKKKYIRYEDLPLETKFGKLLKVDLISSVYYGESGKLVQCIIRDITERANLQEEREKLYRERGRIFLNISHELKTPLTPVMIQAEMLKNEELGKLSPRQKKSLDLILDNMERLNRLITDVLDIARIQAGALQLVIITANLKELIEIEIAKFKPIAQEKGIVLTSEVTDIFISCDVQRIGQVFSNLISNALKFTPKGSVTISAKKKKDVVVVSVRDTGIGIAKGNIAKLFTPLYQAAPSYTLHERGTGLGLSITKGIVQQHGGKIWVESKGEGKGSTFYLSLPLKAKNRRRLSK